MFVIVALFIFALTVIDLQKGHIVHDITIKEYERVIGRAIKSGQIYQRVLTDIRDPFDKTKPKTFKVITVESGYITVEDTLDKVIQRYPLQDFLSHTKLLK